MSQLLCNILKFLWMGANTLNVLPGCAPEWTHSLRTICAKQCFSIQSRRHGWGAFGVLSPKQKKKKLQNVNPPWKLSGDGSVSMCFVPGPIVAIHHNFTTPILCCRLIAANMLKLVSSRPSVSAGLSPVATPPKRLKTTTEVATSRWKSTGMK